MKDLMQMNCGKEGYLVSCERGGELRTEELGTEVEAGCDALYATFCAQVWGAGAMMDGW